MGLHGTTCVHGATTRDRHDIDTPARCPATTHPRRPDIGAPVSILLTLKSAHSGSTQLFKHPQPAVDEPSGESVEWQKALGSTAATGPHADCPDVVTGHPDILDRKLDSSAGDP